MQSDFLSAKCKRQRAKLSLSLRAPQVRGNLTQSWILCKEKLHAIPHPSKIKDFCHLPPGGRLSGGQWPPLREGTTHSVTATPCHLPQRGRQGGIMTTKIIVNYPLSIVNLIHCALASGKQLGNPGAEGGGFRGVCRAGDLNPPGGGLLGVFQSLQIAT